VRRTGSGEGSPHRSKSTMTDSSTPALSQAVRSARCEKRSFHLLLTDEQRALLREAADRDSRSVGAFLVVAALARARAIARQQEGISDG